MKTNEWEKEFDEMFGTTWTDFDFPRASDIKLHIKSLLESKDKECEERVREERERIEKELRAFKFQTYSADTAIMSGNTVMSHVKTVDNLIKAEDLDVAIATVFMPSATTKTDKQTDV